MTLSEANFDDLLQSYLFGTTACVAERTLAALVRNGEDTKLRRLLRDYRTDGGIYDRHEIDFRAAVDRLMTCYSIIEISCLSGFVDDITNSEFAASSRAILEDRNVRRYYEDYYPLRLPRLFRHRLQGRSLPATQPHASEMLVFLDLDRRFMKELEDGIFLRMLDSFWYRGIGFRHVVETIGQPETFIDHILRDPSDDDIIASALKQFSAFMAFCFDLEILLARVEDDAVLQSAMWHHYGYWFGILGQSLSAQLGSALSQFLRWQPPREHEDAAEAVQMYVSDARHLLARLTSHAYSAPVEKRLRQVSDSHS